MRWENGRRSENVEDRRGIRAGGVAGGRVGVVVIVLTAMFFGVDPRVILQELEKRFGVPGEFAKAYVAAHEAGHHVQNLLGTFNAGCV